jgi:hypothetical protein
LAPLTDQDKLAERHAIAGNLPGVYLRPRVSERHASRNDRLEHFQEKLALAEAGVESGFPSENATMQK